MAEAYKSILENEEQLNNIAREAFDNVNTNQDGKIDKSQLESMMNQVYSDIFHELPSKSKVDDVFDYLDSKKKGYISFEDFKVLVKDVIKSMIEALS